MSETRHTDERISGQLQELRDQLEIMLTAQKGYEEIFLSTNDNRSDIVLLVDKKFMVYYASPSCLPILGYTPREIIGSCCLEYVHPDDLSHAVDAFFTIAVSGECDARIEFRLLHKNGYPVTIEAVGKHMENFPDDRGIIIHYRNITRQKQSEQAIYDQKQFYETILNSIYDGVCVTDKNDVITFINRGFSTTMSMPAEDVIGKKILPDILASSTQFFQYHYYSAHNSLQPVNFESIPVTTSAGISIFLSGWCIPRRNNGFFDGMICTFTNITEQQLTKEKLSESEIRFRSIAETATDSIITVNGSGEVVFWNSAASLTFGFSESEVMGRDLYQIMPEEVMSDHVRIFTEDEESAHLSSIGRTVEGKARRKDGTIFPIELSIASWMIGAEVYYTAIIRDITLRKRIEQSLHNSEQELKTLSSRLLNVHEMERKRIAYELHDGLGQILSAAMIGAKSILTAGNPPQCNSTTLDSLLTNIQAAIEEVRRISRDLRPSILDDLGIITAINAFCQDFGQLHTEITVIKKIACRNEAIPEQLKIVIYRVIQEACANIVRHSHADVIIVRLSSDDGGIKLSIHDNGTGFDVQKAYLSKQSGRGLGLSSMRERVEYSGGFFLIESNPDSGTAVQACWS